LEFFINTKAYESLSAEYKSIVDTAAAYAHQEVQAKYDAKNPLALKQLVASKTKVLPFSKDIMDRAYKESMALYSELSAKNPHWKKIYEDYAVFRKDANLWFRFTEARFDSFMQAQKM
jgi:TRAP-type mannitol/chloroaromatic compound transport system substrate-binding protein